MIKKTVPISLLILLFSVYVISSQESPNTRYAYPFSLGIEYIPFSSTSGVEHTTAVNSVKGRIRVPLPFIPSIQPFLVGGLAIYDVETSTNPVVRGGVLNAGARMPEYDGEETLDHQTVFSGLGVGYAHRINKEFEVGVDLSFAAGLTSYPNMVVDADGDWYPVGEWGSTVEANGKITINPSYSMSIDVLPTFRYERSFGNIKDFDGFYFGLGFAAHYRFGRDPDSPLTEIRALKFAIDEFPPVFAAMQKIYVKEPITYITITNREKSTLRDLEVNFNQEGYMDSPTLSFELDELSPGESAEIPLYASFSDAIFTTVGVVPLNGEIMTTYEYRGQVMNQNRSVTFNLHDKNSMTWDDDRKVAAYITPKDSAVRNFSSFVADRSNGDNNEILPDPLEKAMQAYHALAAQDLGYQSDPASPFVEAQGSPLIIDTVSLPRETLARGTGDCDDITVLFNTMLESINVHTGIVTVPGHIYSAVDTGLSPRDYGKIHPLREMSLVYNDTLWILVEITLIGEKNFLEAWQKGMDQWWAYDEEETLRAMYTTAFCQIDYKPVGLQETDIGLQYGDPEDFLVPYRQDRNTLGAEILRPIKDKAANSNRAVDWNSYGIAASQLNMHKEAETAFATASRLKPDFPSSRFNLGNLFFRTNRFPQALNAFKSVENIIVESNKTRGSLAFKLYINIARTLHAMSRYNDAKQYYDRAREIDPEKAAPFSRIFNGGVTEDDGAEQPFGDEDE